ncbi:MAG: ABC-F family ATP-binding cassette domain-containing protein [Alphaproteobacteria bacterium]
MISAQNISFRFGEKLLLNNASFSLQDGNRVALIGSNGVGKSTLLKLLSGELSIEAGIIERSLRKHMAIMEQDAPEGTQSILDTVLSADTERTALLEKLETAKAIELSDIHDRLKAISADSAEKRASQILLGLGFSQEDLTRATDDFSGGWRMRLSLARILYLNPDIMLLDEPTNHLDLEAVLWLTDWLKRFSGTLIFISHDRDLLNAVPNNILYLINGELKLYGGNFDNFIKTRRTQMQHLSTQIEKQEKQRAHLQAFVDRFRYKASKAKQAQSRVKMLEKLEPIHQLIEPNQPEFYLPEPELLAPPIYTADRMNCGYEQGYDILHNLTFRISMGDRIGLLGANGNGKTTLMRLLAGQIPYLSGEYLKNPKLRIGYFSQDQADNLPFDLDVLSYMRQEKPKLTEQEHRDYLGRFGFRENHIGRAISSFSGGEKARLLMARIFMDKPHLLLLDEPSNHLDIESREALIQALQDYEGAVITVSHDSWFLSIIADRLWLIKDGRLSRFEGDIEDYQKLLLSEKNEKTASTIKESNKPDKKELRKINAEKREKLAPLRKEITKLDKLLVNEHKKTERIKKELSKDGLFEQDNEKFISLNKEFGILSKKIEDIENEWLHLSEQLELLQEEDE